MAICDESVAAAMFTRLFPTNMVDKASSKLVEISSAFFAPFRPSSL